MVRADATWQHGLTPKSGECELGLLCELVCTGLKAWDWRWMES